MIGTLLTVFLILAVGTHAADKVNVRQQEIVLGKLPVAEASAYYDVLRRRVRRIRVLRAIALTALFCLLYAYRHRPVQLPSQLDHADRIGRVAPGHGRAEGHDETLAGGHRPLLAQDGGDALDQILGAADLLQRPG